jgi:hypothetical protein
MTDDGTELLERSYRYPPRARWSYLAGAVASGVMAAGALALQFAPVVSPVERAQLLIFTLVFAAVLVHALGAVRTMGGEVRLARGGVGSGLAELVPWSDVARVEIRPLHQRMDVFTASGRRFLSLRPELDSFAAVQDHIIAHMQPRGCSPPCRIPLLSRFVGAPLAIMSVLLAVWLGPERGPLPAALFAAFGSLLGLLHLARRRRIDVGGRALVLKEGWRRQRVAYREVRAVHVQARPRFHGGAAHYLVLERVGAGSITIAGFRHGYHAAYQCIEAAWRAARDAAEVVAVPMNQSLHTASHRTWRSRT